MNIQLNINFPPDQKAVHVKGVLLSFFTAVDEVVTKQRRGSYLSHFYQERLDKSEKRALRSVIGQIQKQLQKSKTKEPFLRQASIEEEEIPIEVINLIKSFQEWGK